MKLVRLLAYTLLSAVTAFAQAPEVKKAPAKKKPA